MTIDRNPLRPRVRFGDFEADINAGELRRRGEIVPIQDLPFRLLAALLRRPGQIVTRTELREELWGDATFVDYDAGLNTAIAKLREALLDPNDVPDDVSGDATGKSVFIETLPKRGYRFIGATERVDEAVSIDDSPQASRTSPETQLRNRRVRTEWVAMAVVAMLALSGYALYNSGAFARRVSIAVVLFDNETDRPELDRVAQTLTDSTVLKLTAEKNLAVIGNAAVLRTPTPFRDLVAIRNALHVDYIVIGQVQKSGDGLRVLTHLIRTSDQSHVWVQSTPFVPERPGSEAALDSAVADAIDQAVVTLKIV